MAMTTANARQLAIRLSNKVIQDPLLAEALGVRVDFKQRNTNQKIESEQRKGVFHEQHHQ